MEELELKFPNQEDKAQVEKYKQEMLGANSGMDGCGTLRHDDFELWLEKCYDWRDGKNLPEGYVPSTQYLLIRKTDNKLIGMLQIRHELNDFLLNFGGHIGGSIAVDERNKGYGKRMLGLGLKKCLEIGLNKVLISCKDTNAPSRKNILANGGRYEDTRRLEEENINLERYWIDIDSQP